MTLPTALMILLQAASPTGPSSTPEARVALEKFAACVVQTSDTKAADVLVRDFRSSEYRNGLKNLARANEDCATQAGIENRMRMDNLPFAAALAEALMERSSAPLKIRLAMAAGTEVPTFSPSDKAAMCVARSAPDEASALFAAEIGSADEDVAAAKLAPVLQLCSKDTPMTASTTGLRSILATASFRLLAAQKS